MRYHDVLELPASFPEEFPLTAQRLDTPEKVQIFLRATDFCCVELDTMARITEGFLRVHLVEGKKVVVFGLLHNSDCGRFFGPPDDCVGCAKWALVVGYEELDAFRSLFFSDCVRHNISYGSYDPRTRGGFDWRTKEECGGDRTDWLSF